MNVSVQVSFDAAVPDGPGASLVRWFRTARTGLYRGLVEAEAEAGSGGGGVSEAQIVPDIDDLVRRFPRIGKTRPQFEEELAAFSSSSAASADTMIRPERTTVTSTAVHADSVDRPQIVRPYESAQKRASCDQIRHRAAAEGKSAALCVQPAVPSKTPKAVARATAAGGATWCEGQQHDVVHVTRTSICENQVADANCSFRRPVSFSARPG